MLSYYYQPVAKLIKKLKKAVNSAKKEALKRKPLKIAIIVGLSFVVFLIFYNILFWGRIYPNVFVADIYLGKKTLVEAEKALTPKIPTPEKIVLTENGATFELDLKTLEFSYNIEKTTDRALNTVRTGNFIFDQWERFSLLFKRKNIGVWVNINKNLLNETLSIVADEVIDEPVYPKAVITEGEVVIESGKAGEKVDLSILQADVERALSYLDTNPVTIKKQVVDPTLSEKETKEFKERAEVLLEKELTLKFEDSEYVYGGENLFDLLRAKGGYSTGNINEEILELADDINRDPQEPIFTFNSGRVEEFLPSRDGVKIKEDELRKTILKGLKELEKEEANLTYDIAVDRYPPETETKDVNDLGIKELIGRGSSRFSGSISSRIHNIGVSSSRFNGVLVEPGRVMSFNEILGDVSEFTGYKKAYVIKDGKTVLGDGGGVCQVSTTFFRAVLNAGLPIVERRAHSYRVGYYEQGSPVGFDATVYSPTTDLKIKNDTSAHILIQTIYNPRNATLAFEIYGTKDGRVASTTTPVVWDITPPPEDLYTDDPTLPAGEIEQIDYKAWGAKAKFTYTVLKDGETTAKTFYSTYQPWQAKFLRGTGPAQ